MMEDLYQKGIAAAEAGDLGKAYQLFAQALKLNPKSEKTWLALGRYVNDAEKKEYCFEKVLSLNPENETARNLLRELQAPNEVQDILFSEDELGAWEDEEESDEAWDSGEDLLESEDIQKAFSEDELGAWEDEEESDEAWDSGEDLLESEDIQKAFFDDELGAWEDEEENNTAGKWTGNWEKEKESQDDWGESNLPPARQPWEYDSENEEILKEEAQEEDPQTSKLRGEWDMNKSAFTREKNKREFSKIAKSCLSKAVTVFFALILIALLLGVASLLLINTEYVPDFIRPLLSNFLPAASEVTEIAATATPENTKTPITLPATWTPTPSPIPSKTPLVTVTPTPTLTLVPSLTPTPEDEFAFSVIGEENGWSRYTYPASDFSISVPPEWVHLELNAYDLDEMLAEIDRNHPGVTQFYSAENIHKEIANGVRFFVIDVSAIEYGETADLKIIASDLEHDLDLNAFVIGYIQELKEEFGLYFKIEEDRIQLANVEAAELIYQVETISSEEEPAIFTVVQYLLISDNDKTTYVLTFTALKDIFEVKYPQILEIAQGFEFAY